MAHYTSVANLQLLGMQYLAAGRVDDAKDCQERMRKRINDRIHVRGYTQSELQSSVERYLELTAGTRQFEARQIANNIRSMMGASAASAFAQFLRELSRHEDLELLMGFAAVPMNLSMRRELELACIRLAGYLGINLHDWSGFVRFRKHPLSSLWRLLYESDQYTESVFKEYRDDLDLERAGLEHSEVAEYFHAMFFHVVASCVAAGGTPNTVAPPKYQHRTWLSVAAAHLIKIADVVGSLLARGEIPSFSIPFRLCDSISIPNDFESRSEYQQFRVALVTIAVDIYLVVRLRSSMTMIPSSEWTRATGSPHFLMHHIRDRYLAAGYKIISTDVIESHIKITLHEISNSVSRLNERTESYVDLCGLAIHYDLQPLAKELLLRALTCVIGYGWRKDPSLSYVLHVIESMIPVDPDFTRQMVHRIAPIIDSIGSLTEDDGVRESDLADVLLQLMPESYVAYYRHWLEGAEWYSAERVFARMLALHDLSVPGISLATAAVWSAGEVGELRERANEGDEYANTIINENARRFGYDPNELGNERVSTSSSEEKDFSIDVNTFPPGSLLQLLAEIKAQHAYTAGRNLVHEWFSYWVGQKQGIPILRDLEQFLSVDDLSSEANELFDLAFLLSLTLEGKNKAYKWLTAAQISRRGWSAMYYGRRDAQKRFSLFATHYLDQWREFIAETTKSPAGERGTSELTIPHDQLVDFLIAIKEYACAKEVVIAMVDATVEDFSDVSLEVPAWLTASS